MKKPKFKILSIDGGGIRGIIPCIILEFIESQIGSLSDTFDLMAGTSTGGILTMGLATPNKNGDNAFYANDILELYVNHGDAIFERRSTNWLNKLMGWNKHVNLISQQPYKIENLEKLLEEKFENVKLSETLTDLLITAYDIEKGKAFYFLSRLAYEEESENFMIKEVARSTSAAPTFFTPSILNSSNDDKLALIDGGVFANNPSILAYAEAKELWKRRGKKLLSPNQEEKSFSYVTPDNNDFPFFMLSLGTGYFKKSVPVNKAKKWKTINWIQPLLSDVFMRSVSESTHYSMQYLLPDYNDATPRYRRFNIEIPEKNSQMDDSSKDNIDCLCSIARRFVKDKEDELLKICELLS